MNLGTSRQGRQESWRKFATSFASSCCILSLGRRVVPRGRMTWVGRLQVELNQRGARRRGRATSRELVSMWLLNIPLRRPSFTFRRVAIFPPG